MSVEVVECLRPSVPGSDAGQKRPTRVVEWWQFQTKLVAKEPASDVPDNPSFRYKPVRVVPESDRHQSCAWRAPRDHSNSTVRKIEHSPDTALQRRFDAHASGATNVVAAPRQSSGFLKVAHPALSTRSARRLSEILQLR